MFGIGGTELVIILIFAFLVLGPDRLPQAAKTFGQAIAKFRSFQAEVTETVKSEVNLPDDIDLSKPLDAIETLSKPAGSDPAADEYAARKAKYEAMRQARREKQKAQEQAQELEQNTSNLKAKRAELEAQLAQLDQEISAADEGSQTPVQNTSSPAGKE